MLPSAEVWKFTFLSYSLLPLYLPLTLYALFYCECFVINSDQIILYLIVFYRTQSCPALTSRYFNLVFPSSGVWQTTIWSWSWCRIKPECSMWNCNVILSGNTAVSVQYVCYSACFCRWQLFINVSHHYGKDPCVSFFIIFRLIWSVLYCVEPSLAQRAALLWVRQTELNFRELSCCRKASVVLHNTRQTESSDR